MKPWEVVAFHSDVPMYIECAKNLTDSLTEHNIPFSMYKVNFRDYGSWQKTAESKSKHILYKLETCTNNLVYLDADAVVNQYPSLFDTITEDVAVHYKDGHKLLASTIYFKNCDKVKDLVREWIRRFPEGKNSMREQWMFDKVLQESDCSVYRLPPSYALIFDTMKGQAEPIIEQFQASRKGRRCTI